MYDDETKRRIAADYHAGVPVREIARRYGCSIAYPSYLVRRARQEQRARPTFPPIIRTGEHVRQARKALGLTQAELALKLGVSEISVRLWELGKRNVTERCAKNLAALH